VAQKLDAVDSILVVDVGNSRIGLAVWDDDGLHDVRHVPSDSAGIWRGALEETWATTSGARRRAVAIASVAPASGRQFADLIEQVCDVEPLFVRTDIPLPMPLDIDNPRQIGVDRVCAAAAAFERLREPCAVASLGTAMTVDCVSGEGRFLGGAILPGLEISCQALHEHTARLPRVAPDKPGNIFARNTHDAIVNGVVYAAAGALREIVERFATELKAWPKLVITGGGAPLVADVVDFVDAHVPNLCLMGIALAYRKAAGKP